jgi:Bacterial SH3 domain
MMRLASLTASLIVTLSSFALAATGDHWLVTGNGVNVRARPDAGAPVLFQVSRNAVALEVGRNGEWVEVRLPDRHAEGWVHSSLLSAGAGPSEPAAAAAADAKATSPAAPPSAPDKRAGPQLAATDNGDALARFRDTVTYLNNRAVAAAGIDLFTGVKQAGDHAVQVTATDAWKSVPEGGQDSFMRTLFNRWLAATGSTQPVRVQVVDQAGHVLKEKSGP